MNKFENVPADSDTAILYEEEVKIEEIDALYQVWFWDGIKGESLIFCNEDVTDLSEEEIIKKCDKSERVKIDDTPTYKKSDSGYAFVNFNFITE